MLLFSDVRGLLWTKKDQLQHVALLVYKRVINILSVSSTHSSYLPTGQAPVKSRLMGDGVVFIDFFYWMFSYYNLLLVLNTVL